MDNNSKDKLIENGWEIAHGGYFVLDAHALYPSQCPKDARWSLARIPGDFWNLASDKGNVSCKLFEDIVDYALFTQDMHKKREEKSRV